MSDEAITCACGTVAHIKRQYVGKSIIWVIECPKCHEKVMAMNKRTAIRNFGK